jgi:hypothetical protein
MERPPGAAHAAAPVTRRRFARICAKECSMTNDKKLNAKDLAKVQGGKGRAPARASSGRATGSASGKGTNVGSKRR